MAGAISFGFWILFNLINSCIKFGAYARRRKLQL